MTDCFDDFERQEEGDDLLPEDHENIEKACELTETILSEPQHAKSDDVHSALEIWEEVYSCLSDSKIADRIGEVMELLDEISRKGKLSAMDTQLGKDTLHRLIQLLGNKGCKSRSEWGKEPGQ